MDKKDLFKLTEKSLLSTEDHYKKLLKELSEREIHDFRVSIRKLFPVISLLDFILERQFRESLSLHETRYDLKRYFKSLSDLRDVQVQASHASGYPGMSNYIDALKKRESRINSELSETIKSWKLKKSHVELMSILKESLHDLKPEGLDFYMKKLDSKLKKKVKKKLSKLNDTSESYHKLRISIKKYRYFLEMTRPESNDHEKFKYYQDKLGKIQDFSVMLKEYEDYKENDSAISDQIKADIEKEKKEFNDHDVKTLKKILKSI